MAGLLADYYLDLALSGVDSDTNLLVICSALPTTYTEAYTTYKLGSKTSPTVSAPADASPNGRKVTVSAITDGSITASGTATHYALVNTTSSRLIAAQALSASQVVTSGNTFALGAIDIRIPDAA